MNKWKEILKQKWASVIKSFEIFIEYMAMGFGTILYSGSLEGGFELSNKVKNYFKNKHLNKKRNDVQK